MLKFGTPEGLDDYGLRLRSCFASLEVKCAIQVKGVTEKKDESFAYFGKEGDVDDPETTKIKFSRDEHSHFRFHKLTFRL